MIIFDHIPKTAGTTIRFILRNTFGIYHCDSHIARRKIYTSFDLRIAKRIFPNIKALSGHSIVRPAYYIHEDNACYITFLRDPEKRCISHYQDNCLRGGYNLPIEEWLKDKKVQNMQIKQIVGEPDLDKAKSIIKNEFHFVGLTEYFDESIKLLNIFSPYPLNLRYNKRTVPKNNKIKNRILQDPQKLKLIRERNSLDIELYQYVYKEIFTRYLSDYKNKIEFIKIPPRYDSPKTKKFRLSKFYNKFIYKPALIISNKRGKLNK